MKRTTIGTLAAVVALTLAACSGGGSSDDTDAGTSGASGDPVRGGTARVLQVSDAPTLDPATMINSSGTQALVGNALYGQLLIDDPKTGEVLPGLTTWSTSDDGATWDVEIKDGVAFSDGTPFNSEAIVYNLERAAKPDTGSPFGQIAASITKFEVVDDTHLKLVLDAPNAAYPAGLVVSGLNWVASPTALEKGAKAFDANPVGAGPYVLKDWRRGAKMVLDRNEKYFDTARSYLDSIEVTFAPDSAQRVNTLSSNGADLAMGNDEAGSARARTAGLVVDLQPISGASMMMMNASKAPFDDVRAREAMSKAIDRKALNVAVYGEEAIPVKSLFAEESPFHSDTELAVLDAKRAQSLLDELAADGKPLAFTITTSPGGGAKIGEAMQAQLSAFKNVEVKVQSVDSQTAFARSFAKDYDMLYSGPQFVDPDASLFTFFHSTGGFHIGGLDSPELDAFLEAGRSTLDVAERAKAYNGVEQEFNKIFPGVFLFQPEVSTWATQKVGGVSTYGLGSLRPELLWLSK